MSKEKKSDQEEEVKVNASFSDVLKASLKDADEDSAKKKDDKPK